MLPRGVDARSFVAGCVVGALLAVPAALTTLHSTLLQSAREAVQAELDVAWSSGHVFGKPPPEPRLCPPCEQAKCPDCVSGSLTERVERLAPRSKGSELLAEEVLALESHTSPSTRCVAPALDEDAQSKTLRKMLRIWVDPGPDVCPVPLNLDAGLCVRGVVDVDDAKAVSGGGVKLLMHGAGLEYRCLPTAVVIGAQKAGTRMLLNYLTTHPRIVAPTDELHFLNRDLPSNIAEFWRA